MTSSSTANWDPDLGDLVLEAFSRLQIHPPSLTANHMQNATRSARLLLVDWDVIDGPNLWKQELLSIPLAPGIATYSIPSRVVAITDYFVRQFQCGAPVNLAPAFTTTLGSTSVNVNQPQHGMVPGNWIAVTVPVAVGGIVLLGFYSVTTVIDGDHYTITVPSAALSAAGPGGLVPSFTTTLGSVYATVTLPNHGKAAQQLFSVEVPTTAGGVPLSGVYTVVSVIDANQFIITMPQPAGSAAAVFENAGLAQIENQLPNVLPQDRIITPLSRTEYAALPEKLRTGLPTSVLFLRTRAPTATLWMVPDDVGPYVLFYWAVTQIEDAVMNGGVTMDMPHRFLEAFASGLAAKLARKFPPPPPTTVADLQADADKAWAKASKQDTEEGILLSIIPGLSGYFR